MQPIQSNQHQYLPKFGMAFRKNMTSCPVYGITDNFKTYISFPKNLRGWKSWVKNQETLKKFDTFVDNGNRTPSCIQTVNVVRNSDNKIVGRFYGFDTITGVPASYPTANPVKKLYYKIFKPEMFLPRNLIEASKYATKLEILSNQAERMHINPANPQQPAASLQSPKSLLTKLKFESLLVRK